jgi:hypothetical protein
MEQLASIVIGETGDRKKIEKTALAVEAIDEAVDRRLVDEGVERWWVNQSNR